MAAIESSFPSAETPLDAVERRRAGARTDLPIIDVDTHCGYAADAYRSRLPARWRRWVDQVGIRSPVATWQIPRQREFAHALDSVPPNGIPGSDPEFAREQLLDQYGLSAAFLNVLQNGVGGHEPSGLAVALARAQNEHVSEEWFPADERWYGSMSVPVEQPLEAVREIERCVGRGERWAQVMVGSRTEAPFGNTRYWPIIEAAVANDLPLAFHVGICRSSAGTACGTPSFYYEDHVGFVLPAFSLVSSLIFEGVFDRFPTLKIVLVELGWSWVVPFAWRLDASWRVFRDEVPHLTRRPSEYLRDHFWFTSQPFDEPERARWIKDVYAQFARFGLERRLMFSSDYPHWDFDSPTRAIPPSFDRRTRSTILALNASELYGIPLADPPDLGTAA